MTNQRAEKIYMSVCRGIASTLIAFIIYKLTVLSIKLMATTGGNEAIFSDLPDWAVYLTAAISAYLIYNSVVTAFAYYSRDERARFIAELEETDTREIYFKEQIKSIFLDTGIHIEAVASLVPLTLLAIFGGYSEIPRIFFPAGELDVGYIAPVALIPVCALSFYLSRYEARRFWLKLWREKNTKKLNTVWGLALRFAIILIIYPTVYPWAPLLAFVCISLGAIISRLTDVLTVLGFIAAIIFLLLLSIGIKLLSAMRKRKRFLTRLSEIASEEGAELSPIRNPYRSFIDASSDCSFTVKYDDEEFNCILISTLNKSTPFIFTSSTGGYFRHRLGTRGHHIDLSHVISFYHKGGGRRIVILSPTPKYIFVEDMGVSKEIIDWEYIFGFTMHSEESFLGGLDRRCLGKYEPKFH